MPFKSPVAIYEARITVLIPISRCSKYFASLLPAMPLSALCILWGSKAKKQRIQRTVQATMDTSILLQPVISSDSMKVSTNTSLNSHCNQPFFTRTLQSYSTAQASEGIHFTNTFHGLCTCISFLPKRVCAMWNHQAGNSSFHKAEKGLFTFTTFHL